VPANGTVPAATTASRSVRTIKIFFMEVCFFL
jgi:hypothetical protein